MTGFPWLLRGKGTGARKANGKKESNDTKNSSQPKILHAGKQFPSMESLNMFKQSIRKA
jgi:hypothetical protein